MCSHCIIGKGVTFFAEVKVAFAHLEEHIYVQRFSIDPDDFILIQIYVRGNKAEIFLCVCSQQFFYPLLLLH